MAHQTKLIVWAVDRREELKLRIRESQWPKVGGRRIFDFEVEMDCLGKRATGRGTDMNESVALEKACAAAIERGVCAELGVSTGGVAVHTSIPLAWSGARKEAVERAIFTRHVEDPLLFFEISSPLAAEISTSLPPDALARWFETRKFGSDVVSVCLMRLHEWRFVGLAFGNSVEAQFHAGLEALRNLLSYHGHPQAFATAYEEDHNLRFCCGPYDIRNIEASTTWALSTGIDPEFLTRETPIDLPAVTGWAGCPAYIFRSEVLP